MPLSHRFITLAFITALTGCCGLQGPLGPGHDSAEPDTGDVGGRPLPEAYSDCRTMDGDPIEIAAGATIEGDTLQVEVASSGGCRVHEYVICWPDGVFHETPDVQIDLEIYHDANGDLCEAIETANLEIDLTPVRDAAEDDLGMMDGVIRVLLGPNDLEYTL